MRRAAAFLILGVLVNVAPASFGQEVRESAVTFASHSPFSLADVGRGPTRDQPTEARGILFEPVTRSGEGSARPAVVMLHGAAGVLRQRELTYGRQFAARGTTALVIDAFGARRDRAISFIDRLLNITESMLIADAYAGLRFLTARPDVDADRVALIGFSYGGMATTYAAYAQVAERFAPSGLRFAAHVAYYAPCIARFDDHRATGAPLLMLYGTKDAIVDPARCGTVAAQLRSGGSRVEIIAYAGAYHQWDGRFEGPFMIGRNLAPCRFRVRRDGSVRDSRSLLPMTTPFLRKVALALCADDEGYLIGRDANIRARSDRDVGKFLDAAFRLRPAG